ncbi:N-acetylmuramoyl-L-alanine amidase [Acuticoccus sp.]|uniref:N-acetylmuramoyl-L-alanine amidase n=1 Tax=Acuticoccus sp. TaxID=1904378 RepID=UPI003B5170F0
MRKRKIVAVAVAALVLATGGGASASSTVATSAAFDEVANGTRFVLELSGEPHLRTFVVDRPPRLVVDLEDVDFDLASSPSATGVVAGWRYGSLSPRAARIVFDLAAPALVERHFFLSALADRSARLVIDIAPADPVRFARATATASADLAAMGDELGLVEAAGPGDAAVVMIDPGHGGIDPGAIAEDGTTEKELVLAFCLRLAERLREVEGLTVRLTRADDSFLSLNRRIRLARAEGADLLISVHADAAPEDHVQGATVYTLSERASDAEAAALAARENLADAVSGAIRPNLKEDVSGILADLLRRETKVYAHGFARDLVAALGRNVRMNANPHRSARFRVLMAHDIPSVLLELGYLTNADDATTLLSEAWQDQAAGAVAEAVATFFGVEPLGARGAGGASQTSDP